MSIEMMFLSALETCLFFFPLPGLGSTTGYWGCDIPKIVIVIMLLLYFQKITLGDKSHPPKILRLNNIKHPLETMVKSRGYQMISK